MSYLPVLSGYHTSNLGTSHVPFSLCRYWHGSGRAVKLTVPSVEKNMNYPWLQPAMTGLKKSLVYRLKIKDQPRTLAEKQFIRSEKTSPIVYLWAGLSLEIFELFHANGTKIIIERINCHRATSREILKNAALLWEIQSGNIISDEDIESERRKLAIADAIFCPSPMVKDSMLKNGVPAEKLLATSYGWEPERFASAPEARLENAKPVFLFAGTLCLRKGVPLLLEAWKRADVDAELVLCGEIEAEIQAHFAEHLNGKNIRHISYTTDIGQVYAQADVFVFPSLEEGSPLVTYEAMAHGITPLVSVMGAGGIVQHGVNGIVLSEMSIDAWAMAIIDLAENNHKRIELGKGARLRAQDFTWQKVAERRAGLLENKYPELWDGHP
jgi:glycosyltransferase involved in cell wall biosynthesis